MEIQWKKVTNCQFFSSNNKAIIKKKLTKKYFSNEILCMLTKFQQNQSLNDFFDKKGLFPLITSSESLGLNKIKLKTPDLTIIFHSIAYSIIF